MINAVFPLRGFDRNSMQLAMCAMVESSLHRDIKNEKFSYFILEECNFTMLAPIGRRGIQTMPPVARAIYSPSYRQK